MSKGTEFAFRLDALMVKCFDELVTAVVEEVGFLRVAEFAIRCSLIWLAETALFTSVPPKFLGFIDWQNEKSEPLSGALSDFSLCLFCAAFYSEFSSGSLGTLSLLRDELSDNLIDSFISSWMISQFMSLPLDFLKLDFLKS